MITDELRNIVEKLRIMFPEKDLCLAQKTYRETGETRLCVELKTKKGWASVGISPDSGIDFIAKQIEVLV